VHLCRREDLSGRWLFCRGNKPVGRITFTIFAKEGSAKRRPNPFQASTRPEEFLQNHTKRNHLSPRTRVNK
jgi:hypothetical protein